jgi:hypothetical protein
MRAFRWPLARVRTVTPIKFDVEAFETYSVSIDVTSAKTSARTSSGS